MFIKKVIFLFLMFFILNCSEKTMYSGLIINENFNVSNLKDKNELILSIGRPNYIDPIENNYFYFTEKIIAKNLINRRIVERLVIVFKFDDDDNIISYKKFNLDNEKEIKISKDKTKNNLIKKGLIEKVFGGIGNNVTLPNTSQ